MFHIALHTEQHSAHINIHIVVRGFIIQIELITLDNGITLTLLFTITLT